MINVPSSIDLNQIISQKRSLLMGLSMIAVMLYHQWWMDDDPITKFFHMFGNCGVDIFMLISGWGIAKSLQKNEIKQFYRNRIVRILPTCLFAGSCKLLVDYFAGVPHDWSTTISILFCTNLWYIATIWKLYLLSPLFYRMLLWNAKLTIAISVIIAIVCLYVGVGFSMLGISRIPIYLVGMLLGMNFYSVVSKKFLIGSVIACFVYAGFVVLLKYKIIDFSHCYLEGLLFLPCFPMILFLANHFSFRGISFFCWIGSLTLEIYLCHEYIFAWIMNLTNGDRLWYWLIMGGILSFFYAWILSKIIAYSSNHIRRIHFFEVFKT